MRALLLVLAVVAACDAGAKPEPAKQPPRGSAANATDCKAVVDVLEAAALRNWIKEPPPPKPSAESVRSLEAACATWPESFKACVVASPPAALGDCVKYRPEVVDELLLLGLERAIPQWLGTSGSGR